MGKGRAGIAGVFGLLLLVGGMTVAANADDYASVSVSAGQTAVLATRTDGDRPQADNGGTHGAVVGTVDESATPPRYKLKYTAPKVSTGYTETIAYSVGAAKFTTSVTVTVPSAADVQPFSTETYEKAFKVLFVLFVVATLLESALAVLFNWRLFLTFFDARVMRPVVSVGFSYLFVVAFDLDIVRQLIEAYSGKAPPSTGASQFISALMLAGGSAGVNKLLVSFGFREVKKQEDVVPKLAFTDAWISVKLVRDKAKGAVTVLAGPTKETLKAIGVIPGPSLSRPWSYFLRDYGRFPGSGGFTVRPGPLMVTLEGRDADNNIISTPPSWGPHEIAGGAIVDLTLKL